MTTATKHKAYIGQYTVGHADVGYCGIPGSGASQKPCWIRITNRGRWSAECSYSTGCNQGYYQENYSYGPWEGRGDTPHEAISAMLRRVDGEYRDDMRKAAHDAEINAENIHGPQWRSKTWMEIGVVLQQQLIDSQYQSAKYSPFSSKSDEGIDDWRQMEILRLQKRLKSTSSLSHLSDEDLIAECQLRGLTVE